MSCCLCDHSDAYIVVKRGISVTGNNAAKRRNKKANFKNDTPFRSCISKINNMFVDNAEDLDIVMQTYHLLEHSDNNSMTSESLWNYYRENNDGTNFRINNNKTTTSKYFEYRIKIIGSTPDNASRLNAELAAPLQYLSSFWRSLDLDLINYDIELDLTWSKYCVT